MDWDNYEDDDFEDYEPLILGGESPYYVIREQYLYILKLEAQIERLKAQLTENVDLMVRGVQTRDKMMLDLIMAGALSKPRTEPAANHEGSGSQESGGSAPDPQG